FNPHTWPVRTNVELESHPPKPGAVLVDDQDRVIPFQIVRSSTTTSRVRLSFNADLPALGYRTYRLRPEGAAAAQAPAVDSADTVLENDHLRLEIDPQTGYIASLYDKRANVQVFRGEAAKPVVINDTSDTWGHNKYTFDDVVGAFTATSVKRVEDGPVKS